MKISTRISKNEKKRERNQTSTLSGSRERETLILEVKSKIYNKELEKITPQDKQ